MIPYEIGALVIDEMSSPKISGSADAIILLLLAFKFGVVAVAVGEPLYYFFKYLFIRKSQKVIFTKIKKRGSIFGRRSVQ